MSWHWRFEQADGTPWPGDLGGGEFPSQADAESWLGESWRELRDHGVDAVRLFEEGREVYGPMSLAEGSW
jgi:hypothetical protein